MPIPSFPNFKNLTLEDKQFIESFTRAFPPYSDYNFASLWSYNIEEDFAFCQLNNNLVIRFRDYITNDPFFSFLGTQEPIETSRILLDYSNEQGVTPLKLIPEVVIAKEQKLAEIYKISEDKDNFDYIYDLKNIGNLEGHEYAKKRNKVSKFLREYTDSEVKQINLLDKINHEELLRVFSQWENTQEKTETDHEKIALARFLESCQYFNYFCVGVFIKNELKAFVIFEILENNFAITHFAKANTSYPEIFDYLYNKSAKLLANMGCKYLNREQDLGIISLRTAKESWNPLFYLKKYQIFEML